MNKATVVIAALLCAVAVQAQNPWPMERQDRWGTARAVVGPDVGKVTTPWIYKTYNNLGLVSNPPSLTQDGLGYLTSWLDNKVLQFGQPNGGMTGTMIVNNWGQATPAVGVQGEVYTATVQSGRLYRINPGDLSFDWTFVTNNSKVSDYDSCSPTIGPDGNVVMGGTGGFVWKIDRNTGKAVWQVQGIGGVVRTIVFTRDDSKVVVSNGNSITAFDYQTGAQKWTKALGSTAGAPGVAPNGTIVVGNGTGNVYGLNPTNGNQVWTFNTGGAVAGGPAFSQDGNFAYVASYDRKLYAAQVTNGARPWIATTSDELRCGPIVDKFGRIYVTTRGAAVYCVNPDGSLRWNVQLDQEIRGPMSLDQDNTLYVPNMQFRIVRQQAMDFDVLGLVVGPGTLASGSKDKLAASDDDDVELHGLPVTTPGYPVMRCTFVTSSPYKKATKFAVALETRASTDTLTQTVELFNNVSGTWQLFDSRPAPTSDTVLRVEVPAIATDFQDNAGGIRARLSYWQNGRSSATGMKAWIDAAKFVDVVPEFKYN
ncbi:MAG: PQQ-binding-like beta-propeller repeat protein [Armatimonadetes bacterium]|nr:PQQ-binding-like beta-propeller repeat protein [Armatimonadota bacterium]